MHSEFQILLYRWSKCMIYYLATIRNHIVMTEKCTTVNISRNKLANENEHGIKVSQNNLQCKYTTYVLEKKKNKRKARPSYDFFLTHTFNAFYSLDYSYCTSLDIKKLFRKHYTGLLQCISFSPKSLCMCQGVWEGRHHRASNTKWLL